MPAKATKVSADVFDVGFDWSGPLAKIGPTETITGSAWAIAYGSITINATVGVVGGLPGHTFSAEGETALWCQAGTEGSRALLKNTVTTSGGRTLEDAIEITVVDRISPTTVGRYCALADIQNIFGRYNVEAWAKIEDVDTGDVDARILGMIADAEDYVDARLRGTRYTVPFVAPIPRLIVRVAATLAGVYLYEARGALDVDPDTGRVNHRYTAHKKWAEDRLLEIRSGKLHLDSASSGWYRHPQVVDDSELEWYQKARYPYDRLPT